MEKVIIPDIFLTYEQYDITHDISPDLINFEYNDSLFGESDELVLELDNSHGRWSDGWLPSKGDMISAKIGYKESNFLNCGDFFIDEIGSKGGNGMADTFTIKGLATIPTRELRTEISRAFENMKLSEIAHEMANRHGFEIIGSIAYDPFFERVTQGKERDLKFLNRLALDYGYAFSIKGKKLIFHSLEKLNKEVAEITISKNDITDYDINSKTIEIYKTISVNYRLPNSRVLETLFYTDEDIILGDIWKVKEIAENYEQALQIAKNRLELFNSMEKTGRVSLPGNTYLIAGINTNLVGFGKMGGLMSIFKTSHKISRTSGYITELELRSRGYV